MNPNFFDPSVYTGIPNLTLVAAIGLGHELVIAGKDLTGPPAKSRDRLAQAVEEAERVFRERHREEAEVTESGRLIDLVSDSAWRRLRGRLALYADMPVDEYPLAPRAAELVETLFRNGLDFTRLTFNEQGRYTASLLKRIDEEGLADDIIATAGPEFLDHVQKLQPRYEAMVSAMFMRTNDREDLNQHRRDLTRIITSYTIKVIAMVDEDEPASADLARFALRPLTNIRGRRSRPDGSYIPGDDDVPTGGDDSDAPADGGDTPSAGDDTPSAGGDTPSADAPGDDAPSVEPAA